MRVRTRDEACKYLCRSRRQTVVPSGPSPLNRGAHITTMLQEMGARARWVWDPPPLFLQTLDLHTWMCVSSSGHVRCNGKRGPMELGPECTFFGSKSKNTKRCVIFDPTKGGAHFFGPLKVGFGWGWGVGGRAGGVPTTNSLGDTNENLQVVTPTAQPPGVGYVKGPKQGAFARIGAGCNPHSAAPCPRTLPMHMCMPGGNDCTAAGHGDQGVKNPKESSGVSSVRHSVRTRRGGGWWVGEGTFHDRWVRVESQLSLPGLVTHQTIFFCGALLPSKGLPRASDTPNLFFLWCPHGVQMPWRGK